MKPKHLQKELKYIGWTDQVSVPRKIYLFVEFFALFLLLPALIFYNWMPFSKIGILLGFTILCAWLLWVDPTFYTRKLWNLKGLKKSWKGILLRFIPATVILTLVITMLEPEMLFNLILDDFYTWLFIVIFYPLFSVYPQELIYRCFLFHRYQPLFPRQRFMIHVSALTFGYLHIIFGNYQAVFLTYGAGYLFGRTYAETKSLLAASFEHALYGILIFTIGFNHYFINSVVLDLNIFFAEYLIPVGKSLGLTG